MQEQQSSRWASTQAMRERRNTSGDGKEMTEKESKRECVFVVHLRIVVWRVICAGLLGEGSSQELCVRNDGAVWVAKRIKQRLLLLLNVRRYEYQMGGFFKKKAQRVSKTTSDRGLERRATEQAKLVGEPLRGGYQSHPEHERTPARGTAHVQPQVRACFCESP